MTAQAIENQSAGRRLMQPGRPAPQPYGIVTAERGRRLDGNATPVTWSDMKNITLRELARDPKYGRLAYDGQSFLV